MLLLQVASEMGLMTLAWHVGKNFFLPELINQLMTNYSRLLSSRRP